MESSLNSNNNIHYLHKRRKRRVKAGPVIALLFFLLFCLSLGLYSFINSAFFALQFITVDGHTVLRQEEVIDLSGLVLGTNLFKLDVPQAIAKIELHPSVKKVEIRRRFPRALHIQIVERTPVALVVSPQGFLKVDEEGIYLQLAEDLKDNSLPIISGIPFPPNAGPGADLSTPGLMAGIDLILQMSPEFLKKVAEVVASTPYALTLKTLDGIEIRFGEPVDLDRKLKVITDLLVDNKNVVNAQTIEYIDLRYNTAPVIKRKNKNY